MEKGIVMEDIYLSMMNYDDENLIFKYSDDNSKELIGRISFKIKKMEDELNGIQDQNDILSIFKNINEDIMNNIVIQGIQNITDIVIDKTTITSSESGEVKSINYLLTDGINLLKIFNKDFVDFKKSFSNDIIEIYEVLGIEAARNILMNEIISVVDDAGEYINNRHIELLCDIMTSKGELKSINRQGINRGDIGPLAKCSFEDTTDQLIKSSIYSEKDNLKGVSSNIMLGQRIKSGTGLCEILLDEDKLFSSLTTTDEEFLDVNEKNIDILLQGEDDEMCALNEFKFSFE